MMKASDTKQEPAVYQAYKTECPSCGRSITRAIPNTRAPEFRWGDYYCHFCGSSLAARITPCNRSPQQRVQNGPMVESRVSRRNDEKPGMTLSDRLNLLSLVTLIWVAFVSISVLLALAEDSPEPPADPFGEPYYFDPTPESAVANLLLLFSWFAGWGLINLAIVGRGTSFRGWALRTGFGDVLILIISPLVWTIAIILVAVFESVLASLVILSILPVAILIGLVNLLYRGWNALQEYLSSASLER